jgi:hypothetical protein
LEIILLSKTDFIGKAEIKYVLRDCLMTAIPGKDPLALMGQGYGWSSLNQKTEVKLPPKQQ